MIMLTCLRNNVQKRFEDVAMLQFDLSAESVLSAVEIHGLTSYDLNVFLAPSEVEDLRLLGLHFIFVFISKCTHNFRRDNKKIVRKQKC